MSSQYTEIARQVIQGRWGNGADRRNRLTSAGYNYDLVQREVNRLMGGGSSRPAPAPAPAAGSMPYRQREGQCSGHWTGNPSRSPCAGCWLCKYGCFVLSILYARGLPPNEPNVRNIVNADGLVVWGKAGIGGRTNPIRSNSIGKISGRQHYVYIRSCDGNGNCSGFDPAFGEFSGWNRGMFEFCHYM